MMQVIECAGHPRDLGFAQGVALRPELVRKAKEEGLSLARSRWPSLHPYVKGPIRGSGPFREMIRHYTHLAERVDGLSRGADLPIDSIFPLQDGETSSEGRLSLLASGLGSKPGSTMLLGLSGSDWVVRKSRPEVGFSSIELTRPWSVSSVAGINEASLAVGLVSEAASRGAGNAGSPPVELLVQECLQRFTDVEAGIDWCSHRPAQGTACLLLADKSGSRAMIRFQGSDVDVTRDPVGVQVSGGSGPEVDSLRESIEQTKALDETLLAEALIKQSARAYVRLQCEGPLFEVRTVAGPEETLSLEMDPIAS